MTVDEILSNEPLRLEEFPVARRAVYLAHAGVCPLPRRVQAALTAYAAQGATGDQEEAVPPSFLAEARQAAARLIGAAPSEIAFVGPTSLALSFVAAGLPWRRGDNVLLYADDYPSNVYPWMVLASRGIEVRTLETDALGRIVPEQVLARADDRTRLVALASCHFVSGWRLEYQEIGRRLRERGIWFCLDGIQTLGAFPLDASCVDFLAADAHKWLLGPCAAGILYVRKELQPQLAPLAFGWNNVRCPGFVAEPELVLQGDARRYEAGSANLLGLVGLKAACDLILEFGVDAIAAELLRKRAWLIAALQAKGLSVLGADAPPANASGIVTAFRPGADMTPLHRSLAEHGVMTSLRTDRTGQNYVRFSAHFYNTDSELERAVGALP